MKRIFLTGLSGSTKYDVYVADYAKNNLQFLSSITGNTSLNINSTILQTSDEIMVILSGLNGCQMTKIYNCELL